MTSLPILIPSGFDSQVVIGQTILVGDILAKSHPLIEASINISEKLNISPKKARYALLKNPGDEIKKDDVLAEKKTFFGITQQLLKSSVTGTVVRYERATGNLHIRMGDEHPLYEEHLISPVEGIISVCNNEQIVINTKKHAAAGKSGVGERGEGEVFILEKSLHVDASTEDSNLIYYLDNHAVGKVIVGGMLTRDVLMKGIGMGAQGIIGTVIADDDLLYIQQKQLKTPIVTIENEVLEKLVEWKGKKVFLDGNARAVVFLQL